MNKSTFEEVVNCVRQERLYQQYRWGYTEPSGDFRENEHTICDWIVYLQHYLNIAIQEASTKDGDKTALDNIRKITAMGFACMEQNGIMPRDLETPVINGRDGIERKIKTS